MVMRIRNPHLRPPLMLQIKFSALWLVCLILCAAGALIIAGKVEW